MNRVLVVEDNAATGSAIATLLTLSGRQCEWCANGEGALIKAEIFKPDLVIADHMLPGIDGLEVVRRLRIDPVLRSVPAILITALADADKELLRLTSGAAVLGLCSILRKPFEMADLEKVIAEMKP